MIFIIPVKSAVISPSWDKFSKIFERSLRSVCQQTDQDFKVVVVCNEKPITDFDHPNLHYVQVNFTPPTPEASHEFVGVKSPKEADKSKKILAGLEYSQQFETTHIMVVDADDCISNDIVEFVKRNPDVDGWYSKMGYVYREGSKLILKKLEKFNSLCGTCLIVKKEFLKGLISADMHYGHTKLTLSNGNKMKPLPFPAAVYTLNGENYFMNDTFAVKHLKGTNDKKKSTKMDKLISLVTRVLRYRVWLLTNDITKKFGLYRIS